MSRVRVPRHQHFECVATFDFFRVCSLGFVKANTLFGRPHTFRRWKIAPQKGGCKNINKHHGKKIYFIHCGAPSEQESEVSKVKPATATAHLVFV